MQPGGGSDSRLFTTQKNILALYAFILIDDSWEMTGNEGREIWMGNDV